MLLFRLLKQDLCNAEPIPKFRICHMKKTKKQITNLAYRARQALKDILGKEEIANEKP